MQNKCACLRVFDAGLIELQRGPGTQRKADPLAVEGVGVGEGLAARRGDTKAKTVSLSNIILTGLGLKFGDTGIGKVHLRFPEVTRTL